MRGFYVKNLFKRINILVSFVLLLTMCMVVGNGAWATSECYYDDSTETYKCSSDYDDMIIYQKVTGIWNGKDSILAIISNNSSEDRSTEQEQLLEFNSNVRGYISNNGPGSLVVTGDQEGKNTSTIKLVSNLRNTITNESELGNNSKSTNSHVIYLENSSANEIDNHKIISSNNESESGGNAYGIKATKYSTGNTVTNHEGGEISADSVHGNAYGIYMYRSIGDVIENKASALISAATTDVEKNAYGIYVEKSDNTNILNEGEIEGDIKIVDGSAVITNHGSVKGNISMGAGDDEYRFNLSTIQHDSYVIDGGDGEKDTITVEEEYIVLNSDAVNSSVFSNFEILRTQEAGIMNVNGNFADLQLHNYGVTIVDGNNVRLKSYVGKTYNVLSGGVEQSSLYSVIYDRDNYSSIYTNETGQNSGDGDIDLSNTIIYVALDQAYTPKRGDDFVLAEVKGEGALTGPYEVAVLNNNDDRTDYVQKLINNQLHLLVQKDSFVDIVEGSSPIVLKYASIADSLAEQGIHDQLIQSLDSKTRDELIEALGQLGVSHIKTYNVANTVKSNTLFTINSHMRAISRAHFLEKDKETLVASNLMLTPILSYYSNVDNGVWGKTSVKSSEQDSVSGNEGYDANTYSFTIGKDFNLVRKADERVDVGLAFSYANTNIDGNSNSYNTIVDSYQVNAYGNYILNNWYTSGSLGYGLHKHQNKRHISAIGETADSDYNASQYSALVSGGYNFVYKDKLNIVPSVYAQYIHLNVEEYTESGSSANLIVDETAVDNVEMGAGVDVTYPVKLKRSGHYVIPGAGYKYSNELTGEEVETTARFAEGGDSFTAKGVKTDPQRHTFSLNTSYLIKEDLLSTIEYEHEVRENYRSNGIYLKVKKKF